MSRRRVAVTGLGVIGALGKNVEEFGASLRQGRSGIRPIELVDRTKLRFQNGGEVPDYRPEDFLEGRQIALLDRFAQFGLVAAQEAVRSAGLDGSEAAFQRATVITGSCVGGQSTQDDGFVELYLKHRPRLPPLIIPRTMANAGASHISMAYGIRGPVYTVSTACSSANHAVGQAFWAVRNGTAELAITGGSEAVFSMGFLKAWEAMRVVAPETCRPFSRDRRGLVLGEGGAMLVLEPLEAARARGATVFGEIIGFGMSSDAHHLTQPSVEGPSMAMEAALQDAGIDPAGVGYINAHGTGTLANDPTEIAAVKKVFGSQARRLAISSSKSMHGHALGAAGALEAVATILALREGFFPPTINYSEPDPECDLDVVPNQARRASSEYALSNSFAFGGLNAVLVFRAVNA